METNNSVKMLAETYGTLDLLKALIMRQSGCSEEAADDILWRIHEDVDRMIEFVVDDMECGD